MEAGCRGPLKAGRSPERLPPNLGVDCVIATMALAVSHDPASLIPHVPS